MRHAQTIVWAAGEHPFRLGIGELRAIEQRSDAGVAVVLARLLGGTYKVDDILGVLRLGLIGGGMKEFEAQQTVEKALETVSLYALSVPAADILRRFVMWEADDQPGELAGEAGTSPTHSPTGEPDGQPTTAPGP